MNYGPTFREIILDGNSDTGKAYGERRRIYYRYPDTEGFHEELMVFGIYEDFHGNDAKAVERLVLCANAMANVSDETLKAMSAAVDAGDMTRQASASVKIAEELSAIAKADYESDAFHASQQ